MTDISDYLKGNQNYKGNNLIIRKLIKRGLSKKQAEEYLKKKVMQKRTFKRKNEKK